MPIEEIIEKSFNDLIKAITTDGTSSQLIFPHSNKGDVRHSEQELKQIFLRNVEEDKNYFYSIETPTKLVYCISNSEQPIGKENHETGDHHRSGNYDVTLYSENKIESLVTCIEFKHGYQDEEDICKDFLKLAKEVKLTKEKKNFFLLFIIVPYLSVFLNCQVHFAKLIFLLFLKCQFSTVPVLIRHQHTL